MVLSLLSGSNCYFSPLAVTTFLTFVLYFKAFMKLDKTKYEDDKIDQQKEEEERLLIVMVKNYLYNEIIFFCVLHCIDSQRKMPVIPV